MVAGGIIPVKGEGTNVSLPDRSGPQYMRSLGCWMDISRSLSRAGGDFLEVSQEPARSGHWGDYPSLGGGD